MRDRLTAIDLFCGAGGITLGLKDAGYDVLLASDFDSAAARTHKANLPEVAFIERDIRQLEATQIRMATKLKKGELDLLVGGPPCQGFSILGSRVVEDPRNNLFRDFFRVAEGLKPKAIVIENVPGLATLAKGAFLSMILDAFDSTGYRVDFAELLAAQYGVPQMRWRMIFVAFRKDLNIPKGHGFPLPTHGTNGIGELIPHCTITPEQMKGFITTQDAIGDLPFVEAGAETTDYLGLPISNYQKRMRQGLTSELFNHYAPKLSAQNIRRIKALKPGQDWRDLPKHLLPAGMQRAKRKDHTRRYRRMTWDGVPRSVITRFRDPKSGEYTHPEQTRTISIREAARIQSFPDSFRFDATHSQQYDLVGNAVPPLLAAAIGKEVALSLCGESTHIIQNAFARRPSIQQQRLAL